MAVKIWAVSLERRALVVHGRMRRKRGALLSKVVGFARRSGHDWSSPRRAQKRGAHLPDAEQDLIAAQISQTLDDNVASERSSRSDRSAVWSMAAEVLLRHSAGAASY